MAMNQASNDRMKYLWGRLRNLAFAIGRLSKIANNIQTFGALRNTYSLQMNRDQFADSSSPVSSRWIFGPHSQIRNYWSLIMMLILIYTAFFTPYVVCFIDTESLTLEIVEYTVDGLFFIDILINLNSSFYDKEGVLVSKRFAIFKNYARTWLLLDLIGCFPNTLFMPEDKGSEEGDYNKLVRLLRLPRLYRLLRVLRLVKLLQLDKSNGLAKTILNHMRTKRYKFEILKFGVTVAVLVHIVGCFWFFLAKLTDMSPDTWVARMGLIDASDTTLYIYSIYWVITTLTTVGYGDITPYTPEERIFALLLMAFGVAFYSYTITNLSNIMARVDARALNLKSKLINLHQFAKATALPEDLQRRLRAHVLINHEGNIASWINQDYLLNELPSYIRTQVSLHMHHKIVEKISFLQDKHPGFIANVVPKLRIVYVQRDDFIYKEHEHPDEIYFMTRGRVRLLARNGEVFMSYVQGSYFGEVEVIEGTGRTCTIQVDSSDAELLVLTKTHFLTMLKEYPKIAEEMFETSAMRSTKNAAAKEEALSRRPVEEPKCVPPPVVRRPLPGKTFHYPRRSLRKNTIKPDSQQEKNRMMWKEISQKSRWDAVLDKVVALNQNRHRIQDNPQPLISPAPGGSKVGIVQKVLERYPARSKWDVVRTRTKEIVLKNRIINRLLLRTPPGPESRDMLRNARNFFKHYLEELSRHLEHADTALNATRDAFDNLQDRLDRLQSESDSSLNDTY